MSKHKYLIYQEGHGETLEWADDFDSVFDPTDLIYVAEEYAEYYYNNRDGWESSWPLTFTIANEYGELLGAVSVDMEAQPHFMGSVVKKAY